MRIRSIKRENVRGLITYGDVPAGHARRTRLLVPADVSTWLDLVPCGVPHQLLYRFRDSTGALLYVGVTGNPKERWKRHRKMKAWWDEAASVDLECHGSEAVAHAAEYLAITTESPRYNRHGVRA